MIKLSFTPGTDDSESLALIFEEARRADERIFDSVESFNTRAAAVIGLVAGVLAVVSATDTGGETATVKWLLGAAVFVLMLAGVVAARSWMVREFRVDPKLREETVNQLLKMDRDHLRMQLLANRIEGIESNNQLLKKKRRDFVVASLVALVAVGLFVSVFFVRMFDTNSTSCGRHDEHRIAAVGGTHGHRVGSDCDRSRPRGSH